jgi:hypothetical protein
MQGWVRAVGSALEEDALGEKLIEEGLKFVRTLPPK